MDHDRLFKQLLTTFFAEFLALFLPGIVEALDADTPIEFLDKEVFTDLTAGQTHEVDLVARVRLRGQDAFFLIHVENQSTPQSEFPKRMFRYFARLHEKYDLPIYPVVIFSYDAPQRAEPSRYAVTLLGKTVLQFEYTVIQLNRLPWRRFVHQASPVASALMAKMKMAPKERPRVKLECLRLLATLRLDPARSRLIGAFVESYLTLNADETRQYERALARLEPAEKEATMTLTTSWETKGRQEGMREGMEHIVLRLLRRRLGELPQSVERRVDELSGEQIEALTDALLDFTSAAQVEDWLTRQSA